MSNLEQTDICLQDICHAKLFGLINCDRTAAGLLVILPSDGGTWGHKGTTAVVREHIYREGGKSNGR